MCVGLCVCLTLTGGGKGVWGFITLADTIWADERLATVCRALSLETWSWTGKQQWHKMKNAPSIKMLVITEWAKLKGHLRQQASQLTLTWCSNEGRQDRVQSRYRGGMPKQEGHHASRLEELTGAITSIELKPLKTRVMRIFEPGRRTALCRQAVM